MSNGTPLSVGDYRQLAGTLVKNIPDVCKEDARYWAKNGEELKRVLAEALDRSKAKLVEPVPLSNMDGVWVSDNAKELFNDNLGTVCKTESDETSKSLNDHEIIEKFGEGIIFDSVDDLEATIADLISKQLDGKLGKLLNNGYVNIFYVRKNGEFRYVRVFWDGGKWRVYSNSIDDRHWLSGDRVFRNCGHSEI